MSSILFTTSDNFSKNEIVERFGLIDSTIVVGANIFRDVFASWRDVFGGETKGYRKDLEKMKNAALAELTKKAKNLGANAVISIKVDVDELSGQGKSMFMYNITGSAVLLEHDEQNTKTSNDVIIDSEEFNDTREKIVLTKKVKSKPSINPYLQRISEGNLWNPELEDIFLEQFKSDLNSHNYKYLSELSTDSIVRLFENDLSDLNKMQYEALVNALENVGWFDFDKIMELLKSENEKCRFRTLRFCLFERKQYTIDEIEQFKLLISLLMNDFDDSLKVSQESKLFGSKEVSKCVVCDNDRLAGRDKYCPSCNANYFGFTDEYKRYKLDDVIYELEVDMATLKYIEKTKGAG